MGLGSAGFVAMLVLGVLPQVQPFNVDIHNHRLHRGQTGSAFGYTAQFIRWRGTNETSLLVGAPRTNITRREESGIFFNCPASSQSPCTQHATKPAPQSADLQKIGLFAEEKEFFGLSLTVANDGTAVMCGPLWSDLAKWSQHYLYCIGRCQVIRSLRTSRMVTPYMKPDRYKDNDGFLYGLAESGFSIDSDGTGIIFLGAPGFSISRGSVAIMNAHKGSSRVMTSILDREDSAGLGYAVAAGEFCKKPRICFAVSNRKVSGTVYVLEFLSRTFLLLWRMIGQQEYSSFGSALGAADVTGDGWADLLVGAPTFTHFANSSRSYDQGRVFVYISKGEIRQGFPNFKKGAILSGDEIPFSRFGSAISSIGDINRDSINDLAVGAPGEDGGGGAVYIYLGSSQGPANSYSQKIRGKEFHPPLTSFGTHISKPTSRLGDYNYPAFAVGAPDSSAVVILRTRPILNAHVSVEATPNPVNQTNELCPGWMSGGHSGCVNVTLCLSATFDTAHRQGWPNFDFLVVVEVDGKVSGDKPRRVRLYDEDRDTTVTSLTVPLTLNSTSPQCRTYLGILKRDQIDRNPFVPVELRASFSLNTTSFPDIAPMLNKSRPSSLTQQLRFRNLCGQDHQCQTDLVLSGHIQYVPSSDDSYPFNVINHTKQVDLVLEVVNRQETSFGLNLRVNLTGQMDFWTVTGNTSILCDDLVLSVLHCRGWTPLHQDKAVQIRLRFLADSVPLEPRNRVVTFDVKVMPSDPVENPEMDMKNNVKRLESRTAIVADIRLDGSSTPGLVYVADSERADVAVVHKLLVSNRGPSFLPPSLLNLSLPLRQSAASDLLLTANVTIVQGGVVVECPQVLTTGSVVGDTTTTSSTPLTTPSSPSTTQPSGGGAGRQTTRSGGGAGSSTTDDPFGGSEIQPSKRRRRRRQSGEDQRTPAAADSADGRTQRMDCGRYQCRVYQCPLMTLQAKERAEVNVTVTLSRNAIAFPGKVHSLLYVTTTRVVRPHHALFLPWSEPKVKKVETRLRRVSEGDEINIWYIIGGIIGGLLLLLLICIIAWRNGFFTRADRRRMEKLKEESGFYTDMAMTAVNHRASTIHSPKKTE